MRKFKNADICLSLSGTKATEGEMRIQWRWSPPRDGDVE